jgi:hypothetical protein
MLLIKYYYFIIRILFRDDTKVIVDEKESYGMECERCGDNAIWEIGLLGSRKICNRCHDKETGLD